MLACSLPAGSLPGWAASGQPASGPWVTSRVSQQRATSAETWCGTAEQKSRRCCWRSGGPGGCQDVEISKAGCEYIRCGIDMTIVNRADTVFMG